MSEPSPPSHLYSADTGFNAFDKLVQIPVVMPQPKISHPTKTPRLRTKMTKPIHTASQSSLTPPILSGLQVSVVSHKPSVNLSSSILCSVIESTPLFLIM